MGMMYLFLCRRVADLWKDIVSTEVSEKTELEPRFWQVINTVRNHRMCRLCFTYYTRLLKLEKTIVDNLNDALIPASTERMSYVFGKHVLLEFCSKGAVSNTSN